MGILQYKLTAHFEADWRVLLMRERGSKITAAVLALLLMSGCGGESRQASGHEHSHDTGHHASELNPDAVYQANFSIGHGATKATAKRNTPVLIEITNNNGKPVQAFTMNHEKLLHLIIVNENLSYFHHVHPEYKGEGKFEISTVFPSGGQYKLFADFVPEGGAWVTLSERIEVEGDKAHENPVQVDTGLQKLASGKEIELTFSSKKAKENVLLTFDFRDAETKQGITDLESYLGAVGHVVILSEDTEQYLHVHPTQEHTTGPKAVFSTVFPSSGIYKIWGQFQHQGEVITVSYVVQVS